MKEKEGSAGSWAPYAASASAGATSAPSRAARSRSLRFLLRRSRPRPPRPSLVLGAGHRSPPRRSMRSRMRCRPCPRASYRCASHRALDRRRTSLSLSLRRHCMRRPRWGRALALGWVVEDKWCRRRRARARAAPSRLRARLVRRRWLLLRRRRSAVRAAVGRRMAMGHSTDMACLLRSTTPTTSIARLHAHRRSLPPTVHARGSSGRSRRSAERPADDARPSLGSSLSAELEALEKTPVGKTGMRRSSISSQKPPPVPAIPLLPPIELQAPSPPQTLGPASGISQLPPRSAASASAVDGDALAPASLSPTTSSLSLFFTTTGSPHQPPGSASASPGKLKTLNRSPGLQLSASLGRVGAASTAAAIASASGDGGNGGGTGEDPGEDQPGAG